MVPRWAAAVVRYRWAVVVFWIVAAITVRAIAPRWDDVASDGDFDYLPAEMPSVAGRRILSEAFPGRRVRSEIVLVAVSDDGFNPRHNATSLDLLRRLHYRVAQSSWKRLVEDPPADASQRESLERLVTTSLDRAIDLDAKFYELIVDDLDQTVIPTPDYPRLAAAYVDRGRWRQSRSPANDADRTDDADTTSDADTPNDSVASAVADDVDASTNVDPLNDTTTTSEPVGGSDDPASSIAQNPLIGEATSIGEATLISEATLIAEDFETAELLLPGITRRLDPIDERSILGWQNVIDVLSFDDSVIGAKLQTPDARLAILRLSSELAATENIGTVDATRAMIAAVHEASLARGPPIVMIDGGPLRIEITGSAAIGGEMLIASREAIRYTETITLLMILLILIWIYRAPLLVALPMVSIGVAVVTSMGVVSILASSDVWGLRVFTTSRIFIVVILFGAGTDYCLFLIARLREGLRNPAIAGHPRSVTGRPDYRGSVAVALGGVSGALVGSAGTTIVGLAMLGLAEFGKFSATGPVIALCLGIGLAVCLTLAPALLAILGPAAFWPTAPRRHVGRALSIAGTDSPRDSSRSESPVWSVIAIALLRRPTTYLIAGLAALSVPAVYGWIHERSVTYDISTGLSEDSGSRRGLKLLREHFNIGEINPATVLIVQSDADALDRERVKTRLNRLAESLYEWDEVVAVRTPDDPLGDFPPGRDASLFSGDELRRRLLREHRVAQDYFFAAGPPLSRTLVRFDVALRGDPFDVSTADSLRRLRTAVADRAAADDAFPGASVYVTGTTASLIDLQTVVTRDNRRIKWAVTLTVFVVLWLVLRRWWVCLYLIATVLMSYYATLGITVVTFRILYGDGYVGLDWKLPLFLFVILVAIGQDYNVYLMTRIAQEKRRLGWTAAIRRAVSRTGGIITACGLVMAATFFSMTSSAWLPPILTAIGYPPTDTPTLRGIIQLGFALGLGMIIDTFYVRTILVPTFVAAVTRRIHRPAGRATDA